MYFWIEKKHLIKSYAAFQILNTFTIQFQTAVSFSFLKYLFDSICLHSFKQ